MFTIFNLSKSVIDWYQDLETKVNRQATKFVKTDIKRLEDELADHDLQSRFDVQATSKLTEWEKLVSH